MNDFWLGFIMFYCGIMAILLIFGTWGALDPRVITHDRRALARVALLSPAWPLLLLYGFGLGVRALWRTANWKEGL